MKTIDTLIADINSVLENHTSVDEDKEVFKAFAVGAVTSLRKRMSAQEARPRRWHTTEIPVIYGSEVGEECGRKMVYKFNDSRADPEPMQPHTYLKFMYGDLLEHVMVALILHTGHKVEHLQTKLEAECGTGRVSGRPDITVDGICLDIKTMAPYSFKRLVAGDTGSFGYAEQVSWYHHTLVAEGKLNAGPVGILAIDKVSGKIHLQLFAPVPFAALRENVSLLSKDIRAYKNSHTLPAQLPSVPYGKSGNLMLDLKCRYCPFKWECWKAANGGAGLKAYAYSSGPVWFTNVKRKPRAGVPQLSRKEAQKL